MHIKGSFPGKSRVPAAGTLQGDPISQKIFTKYSKSEQAEKKKVILIQSVLPNSENVHKTGGRPLVEYIPVNKEHPLITTVFESLPRIQD